METRGKSSLTAEIAEHAECFGEHNTQINPSTN
jgi:hypothetical protein